MIGDGPEFDRLKAIVQDAGASNRILFEGRKSQAEVAETMRQSDAFVFPSIRELGAGVVIEAMASGLVSIVTDYGAPGDLAANGRGIVVPLAPLDELTKGFQKAMEGCIVAPEHHQEIARKGHDYANAYFEWDTKASYTARIYDAVLQNAPLDGFREYV